MLTIDTTALVVMDVQGKLAQLMFEKEILFANLQRMIEGAKILDIPILWTEQVPQKLGPTNPEISDRLGGVAQPISKTCFSCCGEDAFMAQAAALNRRQFLLTGIETHICVYQTARDLLGLNYEVHVVTDAVSSRIASNKQVGLQRMNKAGAVLTSTEMALFELMGAAEGDQFRAITRLVK
jgi:nicotinamidase-related amidase